MNRTRRDPQVARRESRYDKTLNLSRTRFPMQANLSQNESNTLKRWQEANLYQRVIQARASAKPFIFHDGPPYANGSIHVGHLLNKILKDFVVRSRIMAGWQCRFVPGWDCHGLPIEQKVILDLEDSRQIESINRMDEDGRGMAIRQACARYARKFMELQRQQARRLLTLADFSDPYLTMSPQYEQAVIEVFASLLEQGVIYRGLKPVHWSIANQTALAQAELEYFDREDTALYVHFSALNPEAVGRVFGLSMKAPLTFLVWTTTPWGLPSNLLIAVHAEHSYALVQVDGRLMVIASQLVEPVTQAAHSRFVAVVGEVRGQALAGLTYGHPFCERIGRVVLADYVTLEEGTGLVHIAPGHGLEDHATGLKEGVASYCPVRGDGTYDDSVPDWLRGVSIWEANRLVVERLDGSGHLFHRHPHVHSYPHDWRSKTPVIIRCTEQWFIALDQPTQRGAVSLRNQALAACETQVRFIPATGKKRLSGMIKARPDWCISRQRAWGLPIPCFRLPDGQMVLTPMSARATGAVFGRDGSDAWFLQDPVALLAGYDPASDPAAPPGLDLLQLQKTYETFDVFLESGVSWYAVMCARKLGFPIDLYFEGSDQHRGWFQHSLLPSLGVTGQSPFRCVVTHGFTVDKQGRKISKSLGNTIEVEALLKDFGADVCRWWVSSLAYENDVKVDARFFEQAGHSYRKVRNTLRFLLANLVDFSPNVAVDIASFGPALIDTYILARAAELRRQVMAAYEGYKFRRAHLLLFRFCKNTLSALYFDAVRDRLYCDRPESLRRRMTQTALWHLANVLTSLLAPILPHTADEAYRTLHGDETGSIHLQSFHEVETAADEAWPRVLEVRRLALKALAEAQKSGLDNPLDAGMVLPDSAGILARFRDDLPDLLGVSRVELSAVAKEIHVLDLRHEPRCQRCWRRDITVKRRSDGGWLSDRDAEVLGV